MGNGLVTIPPKVARSRHNGGMPLPGSASFGKAAASPAGMKAAPASTASILANLVNPDEIPRMSVDSLQRLAGEVRHTLVTSVAKTGGHLAPSLGVVDLTVALLSVFNPNQDKIVWDVGHQAYAYKLLTGRRDSFHTLRQHEGISGFPSRDESPYDCFGVGHSSTSISAALGFAKARNIAGENHHVLSVIGDGALTGGMAYEGFNHAGGSRPQFPFIVILNDNEMSISKNVGALSLFMSRNLSRRWVSRVRREVEGFLKAVPGIGDDLYEIARRSNHSFKNFFTPGILFEALRFNYIGAVDGHNIEELQTVFKLAAAQEEPVLVHVLTQKGKGYAPAENNPVRFHGTGPFAIEPASGLEEIAPAPSYSSLFGDTLVALAEKDPKVVAITAAMPEGTGLTAFAQRFPERFFDVGICEQHAVTFASGLACSGLKPFVAIYSTFMQRAYDQIIHDVCLQRLPVTLCLDRAGLVGEDGATHHGVYDFGFLRIIPGLSCFAPATGAELVRAVVTAYRHDGPFAIRYPRAGHMGELMKAAPHSLLPYALGEAEYLLSPEPEKPGKLAVIAIGNMVMPALHACNRVLEKKPDAGLCLLNARWLKPLPEVAIKEIASQYDKILVVEEHTRSGGFSSAVLEYLLDNGLLRGQNIKRLGIADTIVRHGAIAKLHEQVGLDVNSIATEIEDILG